MKTAVIQLNAGPDKSKNIDKAVTFLTRAAKNKAKFIALPEAFNYRGSSSLADLQGIKETIPGPSTLPLIDLAKRHRACILAGSICEKVPGKRKVYNTSVLINAKGRVVAKYRKINLFNAVIGSRTLNESKRFIPGKSGKVAKAGAFKVGMSICYDLRFPGLYKAYSRRGAQVMCVPAVFTKMTGQAHWEVLLRARAIENLCYVVAPNQVGVDAKGIRSYGNSMIVDPWGKVISRASSGKEEIIYGVISAAEIRARKSILPGI